MIRLPTLAVAFGCVSATLWYVLRCLREQRLSSQAIESCSAATEKVEQEDTATKDSQEHVESVEEHPSSTTTAVDAKQISPPQTEAEKTLVKEEVPETEVCKSQQEQTRAECRAPAAEKVEGSQSLEVADTSRISSDPAVAAHQKEGLKLLAEKKHSDALVAFQKMKSVAVDSGLVNDEGHACRHIGDVLDLLNGEEKDIEDAYKAALRIAHQKDDMELSFYVLQGMASHACNVDDADLAEHFFWQAMTLAQRVLTNVEEGLAEGKLASCLAMTASRREESYSHFRKAISLQKTSPHKTASLHASLAAALQANGHCREALVEYKRAVELAESIGHQEVTIQSLTDLAKLYDGELAQPERAQQCRERLAALTAASS